MDIRKRRQKPANGRSPSPPLRWHRAVAVGCSVLFVLYAFWAYWLGYSGSRPVDFLSFWAAGRLVLEGHAPLAYNIVWHKFMEQTVVPIQGWLPFPYPPPFLLIVTPFALFPLWIGFALWVLMTSILYLFAIHKLTPLPYSLAHPAVLVNTWIGQNGFFTCGIFALGLNTLSRRPVAGGAILGLLIIKPQLALLLPIAIIAARQWLAIVGAAITSLSLIAISYLLFGLESYEAFIKLLPQQASFITNGLVPWNELASPYAFCRLLGVPKTYSFAIQAVVGAGAAMVTWRSWKRGLDTRFATLASATLLVPPYLLTYDSLLLIIPMGWFVKSQKHSLGLAVIWLFCLLPIISYSGVYSGPNTIPLAAILCLWLLRLDERAPSDVSGRTSIRSVSGLSSLA